MTISELRAKQAQLVAEARAELEKITPETDEARSAEINSAHDKAMGEYDRLEARIAREEKLAEREAELNAADERRPVGENRSVKPGGDKDELHRQAFETFLRSGASALSREQRQIMLEARAQGVSPDAKGGYLAPTVFVARVIESLKAYGPMLDDGVFDIINTGNGNDLEMPTEDDTANEGALLGENVQDTEQDMEWGQKTLGAYKYTTKIIRVSEELLQDSAIDVEGRIAGAFAKRIGRIVNRHLTVGTGSAQPNGIVTAAGSTAAAAAAAIAFDDLIELEHSIDPAYRTALSIRWMFNDNTLKLLRKIKDAEGRYIWQPADVRGGAPASLLNYSYMINQHVANVGASAKSVVFGDFSKYAVRRVKELTTKRLVERYADFHQVGFIGFARFDGELLDAAAVKTLTHPAS